MNNKLFDQLKRLQSEAEETELAIKAIEDTKKPFKERLSKIEDKIDGIKEAIIADMKKENVKTYIYGDKSIMRATRSTLQIVDESAAWTSLMDSKELRKLTKLTLNQLSESLTISKLNTTKAKEFITMLNDVGTEVEGTEIKKTEYLTIKSN